MVLFQRIFHTWGNDLSLCRFSELKALIFIASNKVWQSIRDLSKLWWLWFLGAVGLWLKPTISTIALAGIVYFLLVIMAMRSSVGAKNLSYFFGLPRLWEVVCLVGVLSALMHVHFPVAWLRMVVGLDSIILFSPLVVLSIFWMFDSFVSLEGLGRSQLNALKMFVCHYPFFIIMHAFFWYALYPVFERILVYGGVDFIGASSLAGAFLIPWYCAMLMYGYTRFLREDMGQYYG